MKLYQLATNEAKQRLLKFVLKMKKARFLSIYPKMTSPNIDSSINHIKKTQKKGLV